MLEREAVVKRVQDFKAKYGLLEEQDENVVATLHLMNTHNLALAAAQDRTSRGGNDHGIDGWHLDEGSGTLHVYQSKLTSSKPNALKGFEGLCVAAGWLGELLKTAQLDALPSNTGIYNLALCLAEKGGSVRNIKFVLISLFDANEVEDCSDYDLACNDLAKLTVFSEIKSRGGRIDLLPQQYNLTGGGIAPPPSYSISIEDIAAIILESRAQLHPLYTSLYSLVDLYRRRGNLVFEKNVRLYLNTKEARVRLEQPMEKTLEAICNGNLDPKIFPFYHVGVTLAAMACSRNGGVMSLDSPFVINGCQTVNIADRFLKKLEKAKAPEQIERFKTIPIMVRVVTRASDAQLREIAVCNNRQNPIEAWQLFSNDPVHVEIASALRDVGVFYERQKGRFVAEMDRLGALQTYRHTNGAVVTVLELGQVICLCRRQLQWAAKPSEIFINKGQHDSVFTGNVAEQPREIIWACNAHKAVKRGLQKYLRLPTLDNDQTHSIFVKPIVKQSMHFMAVMWLYQKRRKIGQEFIYNLNKIAAARLVEETEPCYRAIVRKTKEFYLADSKNLQVEVASRKLDAFATTLSSQIGLDCEGPMPFTSGAYDWQTEADSART